MNESLGFIQSKAKKQHINKMKKKSV